MQTVPECTVRYVVPPLVLLLTLAAKDSINKTGNDKPDSMNECDKPILGASSHHTTRLGHYKGSNLIGYRVPGGFWVKFFHKKPPIQP
jgi:hypothetical protein